MNGNAVSRGCLMAALLPVLSACASTGVAPNVIVDSAHYNQGHVLAFADAADDSRDGGGRATPGAVADVLASGGSDGFIRLWRLPDGAPVGGWRAHSESVYGLAFLQHDRALLSAGYDGRLAVWRRDGQLERERITPSPITVLTVDEPRDIVLTGHEDGRVRQWRLADLALVAEWALHRDYVRAVALHRATDRIASSGADGQVFVWRAREIPRALTAPPTDARDLVFLPDGGHLLGGGWFKLFRWEVTSGALKVLPTEHGGIIVSLHLGTDGRTLASISRQLDSAVYFLDPETGATVRRFQRHELCGEHVRLSANGRYLATTADDSSVRIWDLLEPKK